MSNVVTADDATRLEQSGIKPDDERTFNPFIELIAARQAVLRGMKGLEQDGLLTPAIDEQLNRIWNELYYISRDLKLGDAQAYA